MPIWWVAGPATYNWYALFIGAAMAYAAWGPSCAQCIANYNNPGNF